jgi:hypothetical protein
VQKRGCGAARRLAESAEGQAALVAAGGAEAVVEALRVHEGVTLRRSGRPSVRQAGRQAGPADVSVVTLSSSAVSVSAVETQSQQSQQRARQGFSCWGERQMWGTARCGCHHSHTAYDMVSSPSLAEHRVRAEAAEPAPPRDETASTCCYSLSYACGWRSWDRTNVESSGNLSQFLV